MRNGFLMVCFLLLIPVFLIAQSENQSKIASKTLDNTPPVAVCKSHVQVSLTDNPTKVFYHSFDDGSYDETCLAQLLVKRMNEPESAFKPFITFTCADIAASPVKVMLRAVDCDGNYNDCWSEADIEDKTKPVVLCPADVTILCTENPNDYFTQPVAIDNCGTLTFSSNVIDATDQCQNGYVSKIWTVKDDSKNQGSCTHRVYMKHVSDYTVTFPNDVTISKCISPDELTKTGEPVFANKQCDLLAVGFTDHDLPVTDGNGCFVRIRKWQIINWCIYDGNKQKHTPLGIKVGNKTYKDDDGYFEYLQYIKVFETADPVLTCKDTTICIQNSDCVADFEIPKPAVVDCSQQISYSLSGDLGTNYQLSKVKPGVYNIMHNVSDGCGNHSFCNVLITVKDCKKPTPVVHQKLATTLMVQTGSVTVWAKDFETSSYDNCTPYSKLKFSFSADTSDVSKVFDCDSLGLRTVKIWVTDEAGNQDFAIATIDIQDNMNACDTTGTIVQLSGSITNPEGEAIADVKLVNPYVGIATDSSGLFSSPLLNLSLPYSLPLDKQEDPKAGLTVLDVILLKDHLLGFKKLSNPYQYLAADADKSHTLNTYDLFLLKQMILGKYGQWPSNTVYNYVRKDEKYEVPAEIWSKSFNAILLDTLAADSMSFELFAVKTGDLSKAAGLKEDEIQTRNSTKISCLNGTKIKFTGTEAVRGIQFGILVRTEPQSIIAEQGTISVNETESGLKEILFITDELVLPGQTLLEWSNYDPDNRAKLSESLEPVALNTFSQALSVEMDYNHDAALIREGISVHPNPAKNAIRLKVVSQLAQSAIVEIISLNGQVIDRFEKQLSEGVNSYILPINTGTGVFIVKVSTPRNSFQEKISIVE